MHPQFDFDISENAHDTGILLLQSPAGLYPIFFASRFEASLLFLFLVNKYEKEKLQRLLQDQLLKDQDFRATIKEKIQTIENINDVIDYINRGYRLGIPISKEIVDEIRN